MIETIVIVLIAIGVAFVSMFPRPKSWAERAGEEFKDWLDKHI